MPRNTEPRLAWTRMPDGVYRCDIGGHRYEIDRTRTSGAWELRRNGIRAGMGFGLANVKRMGVKAAQADVSMEPAGPDERPVIDLPNLVGARQPWVTVYIPSERGVPGRWYVLHTQTRTAYPCQDQAAAVGECRRRNVE